MISARGLLNHAPKQMKAMECGERSPHSIVCGIPDRALAFMKLAARPLTLIITRS